MVEEEILGDDTLRDQVERVAADGLQLGNKLGAANEVDCLEAARLGNCDE